MTDRPEQERVRIEKLTALRGKGFIYPNDSRPTLSSLGLQRRIEAGEYSAEERHVVAGRLVQFRKMGKAAFCHILDGEGKLQLYVRQDDVGVDSYEAFKEFDIGDIIEASGFPFVTKTGEPSLHAVSVRLLVKGLVPLPEKWHGLADIEQRYRQRYVDLIANPEVRDLFRVRSRLLGAIRRFFDGRGFLEVETPVLHTTAGGAVARPFQTHHNSLSTDMVLRIALELPLKKLVVGGLERVYELGRVFRNEGLSRKHNPEFTMLEFYQAYATFEDLMTLTEELFVSLADEILGSRSLTWQEEELSFEPPWPRLTMVDSLYEVGDLPRSIHPKDVQALVAYANQRSISLSEPEDWGRVVEDLWGELVEPKLRHPVFITHHPISISPLSRRSAHDPDVTDRFELIIAGMEMANAFSELNDAEDQRERFQEQARRKAAGDEESCDVEEDFLRALEYGLPPTAGEGIGIDRLVMLFTGQHSIRDVLLFPQMKPLVSVDD